MNIIMAGIDYSLASIEIREKFSFTTPVLEEIYQNLTVIDDIFGAVIISTCNRTEIYLSCDDDTLLNPFEILCEVLNFNYEDYEKLHIIKTGDAVIRHLCELSCGVKSQIWGEDQIITQVKNAITFARENDATDSVLEVMFRNAITSAKKVKTTVRLNSTENSIAYKALNIIKANKNIKNILVIGNGEIGRLVTTLLLEHDYSVTMTLRQYRYGANIVPIGADTINYTDRYDEIANTDAVISATLSPHYTVEAEQIKKLSSYPNIFIDLAVPRDIDPLTQELNIKLYNVDSICGEEIEDNKAQQLIKVNQIIDKYILEYKNWCEYKKGMVCV